MPVEPHRVVSREEWLRARVELLAKEKAHSRERDELTAARMAMPWVRVSADYRFQDESGEVAFLDLFDDKSQLIIYHFMFAAEWEAGCKSCSFVVDHLDPSVIHIAHRDVAFAAVSIAPFEQLKQYKERMGWGFRWVSSAGSTFNRDFHVSFTPEEVASKTGYYNFTKDQSFPVVEAPGFSVFARDPQGDAFHTYGTFGRGVERFMTAYDLLDIVPKGRDEDSGQSWFRRKDEYDMR